MSERRRGGRSIVDWVLGLFTEVRAGESGTTLLLTLNIFLVLTAYYIIKPVREALILSGGGAEVKSYASAGQVLLLAFAVPAYARLAGRFERRKLIAVVTLFFMACLVAFYLWALVGRQPQVLGLVIPIGVVFYLWVGIFNLMVPAQFWSFANDVYNPEEGKRLFVIVAFGASMGAVVGSWLAGVLLDLVGIAQLLLVSAVLLTANIVLTFVVDGRERRRREVATVDTVAVDQAPEPEEESLGKTNGFRLVMRSRYLLMIAGLILLANWVNTNGEYILGKLVGQAADAAVAADPTGDLTVGEWIGKFYSRFFLFVNIAGVALQLFVVSRILKYLGVRVALLCLPLIALAGSGLVIALPVLGYLRWAKTAENATDYSLQNTVRNVLFLPLSRQEKYNAKQAIDTFFQRAGDVLSAALVLVGTTVVALGVQGFAAVNVVLIVVWVVLAVGIGREYRRRVG